MLNHSLGALALVALMAPETVCATPLCTIVADAADGKTLLEQGDCRSRTTPASTFKIPLALMGFDAGYLKSAHDPVVPFKDGYVAWGGANWKQPTDPARWMKYSVVWYSQLMTHQLGESTLTEYARKFGFGNADFSGDPGQGNGLDRAWLGSSLKVSPFEQTAFLRKLVLRQLPVSERAMAEVADLVDNIQVGDGWEIHGKTGAAFPRTPDGAVDEAHGYGWYVGWAIKSRRTFVFAYLTQDEKKEATPAGVRAREFIVSNWPVMLKTLVQ